MNDSQEVKKAWLNIDSLQNRADYESIDSVAQAYVDFLNIPYLWEGYWIHRQFFFDWFGVSCLTGKS